VTLYFFLGAVPIYVFIHVAYLPHGRILLFNRNRPSFLKDEDCTRTAPPPLPNSCFTGSRCSFRFLTLRAGEARGPFPSFLLLEQPVSHKVFSPPKGVFYNGLITSTHGPATVGSPKDQAVSPVLIFFLESRAVLSPPLAPDTAHWIYHACSSHRPTSNCPPPVFPPPPIVFLVRALPLNTHPYVSWSILSMAASPFEVPLCFPKRVYFLCKYPIPMPLSRQRFSPYIFVGIPPPRRRLVYFPLLSVS